MNEDLHPRIARALGWTVEQTRSFSLASLRDLVRPVDSNLAYEIDSQVRSGSHIVGSRRAKPRRR